LPAPVLNSIPEGRATVPDDFEYFSFLLARQNPDNVCSPHTFILALISTHLAAAFIPTLERVGPSRGGFVIPFIFNL